MKKFLGYAAQVFAVITMSLATALPITILAVYMLRSAKIGDSGFGVSLASFLMVLIIIYLLSKIKINKNRVVWSLVFGMGSYLVLGAVAIFGINGMDNVFSGFGVDITNDVAIYIGLAAQFIGIILAAEGRFLVRESGHVSIKKPNVAPQISAEQAVMSADRPAPIILTQISEPIVAVKEDNNLIFRPASAATVPVQNQTVEESKNEVRVTKPTIIEVRDSMNENPNAVVRYIRDKWGNLVELQNVPTKNEFQS